MLQRNVVIDAFVRYTGLLIAFNADFLVCAAGVGNSYMRDAVLDGVDLLFT